VGVVIEVASDAPRVQRAPKPIAERKARTHPGVVNDARHTVELSPVEKRLGLALPYAARIAWQRAQDVDERPIRVGRPARHRRARSSQAQGVTSAAHENCEKYSSGLVQRYVFGSQMPSVHQTLVLQICPLATSFWHVQVPASV
jgi:hypothetical protein